MSKAENHNNSEVKISLTKSEEHHIGILEKIMEKVAKETWTKIIK